MKNKFAASILAFFAGTWGVHRFYLGQVGLGMAYLVFFWTGIPTLISFIDAIVFLVGSERAFDEKYNGHLKDEHIPIIPARSWSNEVRETGFDLKPVEQLEKLYALKRAGVLSQLEFDTQKDKLIFGDRHY